MFCVARDPARRPPRAEHQIRLDAKSIVVDGVPERLARALNNLLDNVARHSPPDRPVNVTVDEHGVTVRDHGTASTKPTCPTSSIASTTAPRTRARKAPDLVWRSSGTSPNSTTEAPTQRTTPPVARASC